MGGVPLCPLNMHPLGPPRARGRLRVFSQIFLHENHAKIVQRFSYVLSKNCIDAQKLFRANSEENVGICVFFLFSAISLFRATLLFRAIIRYFEIFRYFELFRYFVNEGGRKREGDGYLKNCYQKRGEVGGSW